MKFITSDKFGVLGVKIFSKTEFVEKEGNVLFNDTLKIIFVTVIWRQTYGMVKDHSDSEIGNPLPPHGLLFLIKKQRFFYMHHPTHRIAHTTAFVTPVVEHWLEQEIAQWVHYMKDRSDDSNRTMSERSYHRAKFSFEAHYHGFTGLWFSKY